MADLRFFSSNLANALLSNRWTEAGMIDRAARACGKRHRWLRKLVRDILTRFGDRPPHPTPAVLAEFLQDSCRDYDPTVGKIDWPVEVMMPVPGRPSTWDVPAITSLGGLADWLGLSHTELDWFADCSRRNRKAEDDRLRHYRYRWQTGRRGKIRLFEMPKARLKAIQRHILREILDRIPTHDAAHGFRQGHSVVSYVTPHAGRRVVLHLDLADFFASIPAERIHAIFRTAGYPHAMARALTGLCTADVPEAVLRQSPSAGDPGWHDRAAKLRFPHLPQGAPSSPALANLCAYRLDCRLTGLARSASATYTRYADDLAFSGDEDFERSLKPFRMAVMRIVIEEGFAINPGKTRSMRQGVRQRIAGVVINVRPNLDRREFDRLKAILTNCVRHGPAEQNRDGHADFRAWLAGKIAFVAMVNPQRGRRLWELFERIVFPQPGV